ncbi:MAG TPA: PhzF family phenazine biosynthesis protein [Polyangiaceae bacterium]|nr:PhzF family phenazine biosynthesis protein [Polyangiaceae bacterium]
MRNLRYVLCDVFTSEPLKGNPLAVFTDARGLDAQTMQDLAREMNLSESVFLLKPEAGGHARLRIFTPKREIPFAGHPTLGTAFVLGGPLSVESVQLETGVGTISVRLEREAAKIVFAWMTQRVPTAQPFERADELCRALGVARSELPIIEYDNGMRHVFVVLDSEQAVARVQPDFAGIAELTSAGVNVCAGSGTQFKTRMFHPTAGVNEDPATGSAAGPLLVHMTRHGRAPIGEPVRIAQGAELSRPSELFATVFGSTDQIERVEVGGAAVILGRGELRIP